MISIDLIFLTVLLNAVVGTVYMKIWTRYSRRLESKSEYNRIYLQLRIALLFFIFPGILSVLISSRLWLKRGLSMSGLYPEWQLVAVIMFAAAFVWMAGAAWHTYQYFLDVHQFCQICKYNIEIENEQLKEYFFEICKRQHIYKGISIYTNPKLQIPVIFGVLKRTILLPEDCNRPEELQIILEHEMIHAKHNDLLLERIAAILRLVIWFMPGPERLLYGLEDWSETVCDISVCGSKDSIWSQKQYFGLLIQWAQEIRTAGAGTVMALSGRDSSIKTRILRMRHYDHSKTPTAGRGFAERVCIVGVCICLVLCMAFGIRKIGLGLTAQISTGRLLEQIGAGNGLWNGDIRMKESGSAGFDEHLSHMVYLKQGERIQICYEAEVCDTGDSDGEKDDIVAFGTLSVHPPFQDTGMAVTGIIGQDTVEFLAQENGWYVIKLENELCDEIINIDCIAVRK